MQKIAVNKCYGGYGLSTKAVLRYAELKGITLKAVEAKWYTRYWHGKDDFKEKDISRDDSILVKVIEELGEEASGRFGKVEITEIPDGIKWIICEYDGIEWVAEKHRTWY